MSQAREIIFLHNDAVRARFLMLGNIIERKGLFLQVASKPEMREGRLEFFGEDLDSGRGSWINLDPELMVPLGTEI
jgi:hypothetical protein